MFLFIPRPLILLTLLLGVACAGGRQASLPAPPPLVLEVSEPGEGAVVQTDSVILKGRVTRCDAVVACNRNAVPVDAEGRFEVPVALQAGTNSVLVEAWPAEARGGRGSGLLPPPGSAAVRIVRTLTHVPPPLVITVSTPEEGAQVSSARIAIQGSLSDPRAQLLLDGNPVALDAEGRFSTTRDLVPGANLLEFRATASGDRSARLLRSVTHTPPPPGTLSLAILSPAEGLITNASILEVAGTVSDPAASLSVNGQSLSLGPDGRWILRISPPEGPLSLEAVARLGELEARAVRRLIIDRTPPRLGLQPLPEQVYQPFLTLSGRLDPPGDLLTVNGQTLSMDPSGNFQATLLLSPGPNAIVFRAADLAGNATQLEQSVRYLPPLSLRVDAPSEGLVTAAEQTVSGWVSESGATVSLNGKALSVSPDGSISGTCTLLRGDNALEFVATTPDGRSTEVAFTVTCDPKGSALPPRIRILTPGEGEGTSARALTVEGEVDDPAARVTVQGREAAVDADGHFALTVDLEQAGPLTLAAQALNPFGVGHASHLVHVDWAPLELAWADPTPAEGTLSTSAQIEVAATLSRPALVELNGQALRLEPNEAGGHPYRVTGRVPLADGLNGLTLNAVDRAGHTATLFRSLKAGFGSPSLVVDGPLFDAAGRFTTTNPGLTLSGRVMATEAHLPLVLTLNGQALALDAQGRFSTPISLQLGDNPLRLLVQSALGRQDGLNLGVLRAAGVLDAGPAQAPALRFDWPLDGFATGQSSLEVRGRMLVPGMSAALNGQPLSIDPQTLAFSARITLRPGLNTLELVGTDAQGRSVRAAVSGRFVPADSVRCTWISPVEGARSAQRRIAVSGQADQPGVLSVAVNGESMRLDPLTGRFSGEVPLGDRGPNALLLQATALSGEPLAPQRREVIFDPALPQLRLKMPEWAHPGETVQIQVLPESGTDLRRAELSVNGLMVAQLFPPFAAQDFTLPADLRPGRRLPVEVLGTDAEGQTVTLRGSLGVYGSGALVVQVLDDRTGLPIPGALAGVEDAGAESASTDAHGRAALNTVLPDTWVRVQAPGYTPVWRSGALTRDGALLDARLSPLVAADAVATPLSAHGLPGRLPEGWSAASAWWFEGRVPGDFKVEVDPQLPADARLAWVRWDETLHQWIVLATPGLDGLARLPLPGPGGHMLAIADPAPTAPPEAKPGQPLMAWAGEAWREGLAFGTGPGPNQLSTVQAIQGARMEARLEIGFGGGQPIPSGAQLQAERTETYTLTDQRVIEPEASVQDLTAHRWSLTVAEGVHRLEAAPQGLLLRLPVRMSRSFGIADLVQGRLAVAFYHEGLQVAEGGSALIGAGGGSLSSGNLTLSLPAGAAASAVRVRLQVEPGDGAALWPETAGRGSLLQAFQIELVGQLNGGFGLKLTGVPVPSGARPLLLQRRALQGERVVLAVGEWVKEGETWILSLPEGGNPLKEGGAFAFFVPSVPWDWVSGLATLPSGLNQALCRAVPDRLRASSTRGIDARPLSDPSAEVPLSDVRVEGGLFCAASGPEGRFALPAPTWGSPILIKGSRADLGLAGQVQATVPSREARLSLASRPLRVETLLPLPGGTVPTGQVFQLLCSAPIDPASLTAARLIQEGAERGVRRSLSLDGRSLILVPEAPLAEGRTLTLSLEGLRGLAGDTAPSLSVDYPVAAQPAPAQLVDPSRIRLSYPDGNCTVTITVPEGAVPPYSQIQVEAPLMGAVGQGQMPPKGELGFTLKAGLGERLKLRVQLRDGRIFEGTLSRYESNDGSGRVTLGAEGGRIEAPDGSGVAVLMPEGALEKAVELKVEVLSPAPEDLDPNLVEGEQILGRLRLVVDQPVSLKKRPRLEFAAPENPPIDYPRPSNLGTHAVFYRVQGLDLTNQRCSWFELQDTARVVNGKLRSLGGLPSPLPNDQALGGPEDPTPLPEGTVQTEESQTTLLEAMVLDAGPRWIKGQALWQPDGATPVPAAGTLVGVDWESPEELRGRLLSRVLPNGDFVIASRVAENAAVNGAQIFGIDPLSGLVTASGGDVSSEEILSNQALNRAFTGVHTTSSATILFAIWWVELFPMETLRIAQVIFKATPQSLGDVQAPLAEMSLVGPATNNMPSWVARAGKALNLEVRAQDRVSGTKLAVEVTKNGEYVSGWGPKSGKVAQRKEGGVGTWVVPLTDLNTGTQQIGVLVRDSAGNETRLQETLTVMSFPELPEDTSETPPGISAFYQPGEFDESQGGGARPEGSLEIHFSRKVSGITASTLWLERNIDGNWTVVPTKLLGALGSVKVDQNLQCVYAIPDLSLEAGGRYQIVYTSGIHDSKGRAILLENQRVEFPKTGSLGFTVSPMRKVAEVTTQQGEGLVAALGDRMFIAQGQPAQITEYRLEDGKLNVKSIFGGNSQPYPVSGILNQFKAFPAVQVGAGKTKDLLLATTMMPFASSPSQCALYAWDLCAANPELLFAVSLGAGVTGLSEGLDCRDGLIVVGRAVNSGVIISIPEAIKGWQLRNSTRTFWGGKGAFNQGAILQLFYLVDPKAQYQSMVGVGLLPGTMSGAPQVAGAPNQISLVAGNYGFSGLPGEPVKPSPAWGLPGFSQDYTPNARYQPWEPFVGNPGEKDERVCLGHTADRPVTDLAVLPNLTLKDGRTTNLVLGRVPKGTNGPSSLVVVEAGDACGQILRATWPTESPLGQAVPCEVGQHEPLVDEVTKLAAVRMRPLDTRLAERWVVLDLGDPSKPTVRGVLPFRGRAAFSNGKLFISEGTRIEVVKVTEGGKVGVCNFANSDSKCDFKIARDPNLEVFDGPIGSECYTFVRHMRPDLPQSTRLKMCLKVVDNLDKIPMWAIIATSIDGKTYPQDCLDKDGKKVVVRKHIALFAGYSNGKVRVFDQIHIGKKSQTPAPRDLKNLSYYDVNNFNNYYIVTW